MTVAELQYTSRRIAEKAEQTMRERIDTYGGSLERHLLQEGSDLVERPQPHPRGAVLLSS